MHYATLLGYREGPDGNPEIVPEEAETVRQIYRWYIKGLSLSQIQKELEIREMKTARGSTKWSRNTVQSILTNEKYIGNAILQKTFIITTDFVYQQDLYGRRYGWGIAQYATPEAYFGGDFMDAAYERSPEESHQRIMEHLAALFPAASEAALQKLIG